MPPPPPQRKLPRWMLVAAPVLALGALVATFAVQLTKDDGPDPDAMRRYATTIRATFEQDGRPLLALADVSGRWADGTATDADLATALDAAEASLPQVRRGVERAEEPKGAAPAERFFLACVDLYGDTIDAHRGALDATGEERTERNLLARRLRTLADRVYDRGKAIVDPDGPDPEGVTLVRSAPVPDWGDEGLAPHGTTAKAGAINEDLAAKQAAKGTEDGYRAGLRLLVVAEAARARALGLTDLATAVAEVGRSLDLT